MAYKPTYGANRASGIMKTKELAGKSALFNLGKVSPINHDLPGGGEHTHIEDSDRYTFQEDVKTGTENQSRKGRRQLAQSMADAANAESEGFEGTQYNTQGHMRSGSKGSIKLFTNNNILEAKTGTRGGGSYGEAVETKANYKKVRARDVRRQLRATGSATITDGVISSGTTQTRTSTGSTKKDLSIQARRDERAEKNAVKKNLKTRVEAERSRDMLERTQAREKKIAERENKKTNKK
jgi:hypothetical protein